MTPMRAIFRLALLSLVGSALAVDPATTPDGFALPQAGRQFVFPRDHGSHPEFKIEWWYFTGHLFAKDGRRFGLQATFFRRAGKANGENIYLAHMALLDVKSGRFIHQERLNREGWDAAAAVGSLDVKCGPWSVKMDAGGRIHLVGAIRAEASFQLELTPRIPLVVFGENGVSRKGADPAAASHYLTFPRLEAGGTLVSGTEKMTVHGELWMDHEMSSSQLDEGQVGWDWACLQLHDGRSAMVYRMRRKDGTTDAFSTLAWIDTAGGVEQFGAKDFTLSPTGTWRSPHSGAEYPAGVALSAIDPATGKRVQWKLAPLARNQELIGRSSSLPYWEGACRVLDEGGREIGSAFLELTGYTGDLKRILR